MNAIGIGNGRQLGTKNQEPGTDRNPFVVHPFLFALSPILFLFVYNAARLPLSARELLLPILVALGGTLLFCAVLSLILCDRQRAALITSAFVLCFFLYGPVLSVLHRRPGEPEFTQPVWGLLLIAVTWGVIRTRRNLQGLTVLLNVIAGAIVATNLAFALPATLRHGSPEKKPPVNASERQNPKSKIPNPKSDSAYPDIYYIILDSHARGDVLKQVYGVDNTRFLDFLTARGFQVARRSQTNYIHTYPSLASSLNFEYLDSLGRQYGGKTRDLTPLINMIAHNRLVDTLRQHGYSTLVFSSGDAGLVFAQSDMLLAPRWNLSEFQNLLLSTTPLPVILDLVLHKSLYDERRGLILYVLRNLPRAAQARHPVFVFAHIICPHPPFVFGPRGERINPRGVQVFTADDGLQVVSDKSEYIKGYAGQIQFLERQVEETVSRILSESPSPPIIILQADHGPASALDARNLQPSALAERSGILNAICMPPTADRQPQPRSEPQANASERKIGGQESGIGDQGPRHPTPDTRFPVFNDSITPVNTFRIVLNRLFGTDLTLLPDRTYYSTAQASYEFHDVADPDFWARFGRQSGPQTGVTVVAFPAALNPRVRAANYCRRLIALKYGAPRPDLKQFYVRPVGEELNVEAALAEYRRQVQSGDLPELGSKYETYVGAGPDHTTVVALFFPTGSKP